MQSPASRPKAARVLVTAESIGGRRDRRLQDHPAPRGRAQAGKALLDRIRCGVGDPGGSVPYGREIVVISAVRAEQNGMFWTDS